MNCREAVDTMIIPLKLFLANLSSGKERFEMCGSEVAFCCMMASGRRWRQAAFVAEASLFMHFAINAAGLGGHCHLGMAFCSDRFKDVYVQNHMMLESSTDHEASALLLQARSFCRARTLA